jgi:hypothetical protein
MMLATTSFHVIALLSIGPSFETFCKVLQEGYGDGVKPRRMHLLPEAAEERW